MQLSADKAVRLVAASEAANDGQPGGVAERGEYIGERYLVGRGVRQVHQK